MANPFGMAEFSVPQLLGLDMQLKQNRLQQLYQQRQQAREDYTFERQKKTDAESDTEKAAYRNLFSPPGATGVGDPVPSAPAPAPTNLLPGAPSAPSGDVATAPVGDATHLAAGPSSSSLFKPDPARLRALAATGPTGFAAAQAIMKMNAEQVKQAQETVKGALEVEGQIIGGIRKLPPEQRNAEYQRQRANLAQQGMDVSQFPSVWSEQAADAAITSSMKTAEALGVEDHARTYAETVRHNHASEANAAGNLSVAEGGLKVRRDALDAAKKPGANTSTADLLRASGLGN